MNDIYENMETDYDDIIEDLESQRTEMRTILEKYETDKDNLQTIINRYGYLMSEEAIEGLDRVMNTINEYIDYAVIFNNDIENDYQRAIYNRDNDQ